MTPEPIDFRAEARLLPSVLLALAALLWLFAAVTP